MAKQSEKQSENVREQIAAGSHPAVFVTRTGKLALDGIAEFPADIVALSPDDIREKAEVVAAVLLADADAEALRHQIRRAAIEAERAAKFEEYRNK